MSLIEIVHRLKIVSDFVFKVLLGIVNRGNLFVQMIIKRRQHVAYELVSNVGVSMVLSGFDGVTLISALGIQAIIVVFFCLVYLARLIFASPQLVARREDKASTGTLFCPAGCRPERIVDRSACIWDYLNKVFF